MLKKFLYLFIFYSSLFSYELPSINISQNDTKPEIIFFTAQSIIVNDKASFELKWKTINTTKVTLPYLGEMDLSGSVTVTESEFNRDPVTLKAYSDKSEYVDKITLNSNKAIFDKAKPVPKNMSNDTPQFYDSVPRTYGRPYRRYPVGHPLRRY
jgi:hypothetical protein